MPTWMTHSNTLALVLMTFSSPPQLGFPAGPLWILSSCITASPPQALAPVTHIITTITFPSSFVVYSLHHRYFTFVSHPNHLPLYYFPNQPSTFFTFLFKQASFIINHFNNIFANIPSTSRYLAFHCINLKKAQTCISPTVHLLWLCRKAVEYRKNCDSTEQVDSNKNSWSWTSCGPLILPERNLLYFYGQSLPSLFTKTLSKLFFKLEPCLKSFFVDDLLSCLTKKNEDTRRECLHSPQQTYKAIYIRTAPISSSFHFALIQDLCVLQSEAGQSAWASYLLTAHFSKTFMFRNFKLLFTSFSLLFLTSQIDYSYQLLYVLNSLSLKTK